MTESLNQQFEAKTITPQQAASLVKSGQTVYLGTCTSYARPLADALSDRSTELEDVTLACSNIIPPSSFLDCENPDTFSINTYFMGYSGRMGIQQGRRVDYTSIHLRLVDIWCKETCPADIAFFEVSPPDENGYMSYGPTGCCLHPYIKETAQTIVLQINRNTPYVPGIQTLIHISEADYVAYHDDEVEEIPGGPTATSDDPEIQAISRFLLDQIPDGACIQLGIGGAATAVGYGLMEKNDLGCHTELISDSIMDLMKAGVINNSRPKFIPHKTVIGFSLGSKALYEFLDHNEDVCFGPFPIINNPINIAKNDNMISINTAMAIDLYGQIAAEGMGTRQFSGTGGQADYVRGSQLSKGGKSFFAFSATLGRNPDGSVKSRIVSHFPPSTIVTTPRADVQYVVTEYGIVNLKPLTVRDRARALISIAHPDVRAELTTQAKLMGIL